MVKYDICEKIVKAGESRIFNNWHEYQGITEADFLSGLRWLLDDPCNGGSSGKLITRELGCKNGALYRLNRHYSADGICSFREENGQLWTSYSVASDDRGANAHLGTASISCRDRI